VTGYDEAYIERVVQTQRAAADRLLAIPGVHLVALGSKETGGAPTGELAIRVHVDRKRPEAEVPPEERIPAAIEGIPVDVIDSALEAPVAAAAGPPGFIMEDISNPEQDLKSETKRPLVGGVKLLPDAVGRKGRPFGGTLGCLLWDKNNHQRGYALTCQHVIDNNGELNIGRGGTKVGSPDAEKPSTTCKTDNIVGVYLDGEKTPQDSDEAVVTLRPGMKWKPHVLEIGRIPTHAPITRADLIQLCTSQAPVRKRGVRTGLTGGVITDVSGANGAAFDHMRIKPNDHPRQSGGDRICFADEGDSGSVVVDAAGRVLGVVTGRFKTSREGGTLTTTGPDNVERVPARALPIYRVLDKLHRLFASRTPRIDLVLEVAMADNDNEVFTVPGGGASIAVPPELVDAVAADAEWFLGGSGADGALRAPVGRQWFATDPRTADRLATLRETLDATDAGQRLNTLWNTHQREVRALIDHDRRVTLAWHRGGVGALFQLLIRMLYQPDRALPETVNGVPVAVCLDRFAATVIDRGSPALAADLREVRAVLPDIGGRTLPEILVALGAAPVRGSREGSGHA
jgi:hypothetical protein